MQKRNFVAVITVLIGLIGSFIIPAIFNKIGIGDIKVISNVSLENLSYAIVFLVVLIGIGLLRDYK